MTRGHARSNFDACAFDSVFAQSVASDLAFEWRSHDPHGTYLLVHGQSLCFNCVVTTDWNVKGANIDVTVQAAAS